MDYNMEISLDGGMWEDLGKGTPIWDMSIQELLGENGDDLVLPHRGEKQNSKPFNINEDENFHIDWDALIPNNEKPQQQPIILTRDDENSKNEENCNEVVFDNCADLLDWMDKKVDLSWLSEVQLGQQFTLETYVEKQQQSLNFPELAENVALEIEEFQDYFSTPADSQELVEEQLSPPPCIVPDPTPPQSVGSPDTEVIEEVIEDNPACYIDIILPSPCGSSSSSLASGSSFTEPPSSPESYTPPPSTKRGRKTSKGKPFGLSPKSVTKTKRGEDRKVRKRDQNKTAATRYRQKKKMEELVLQDDESELLAKNKVLKDKVEELSKEAKYLKNLMREVLKAKGLLK